MKYFVTGVGGQLGFDVMQELLKRNYDCVGSDVLPNCDNISAPYVQMDITDKENVGSVIGSIKPNVVVHCAAWTAVDLAEDAENVSKVNAINVDGTRNIAEAA